MPYSRLALEKLSSKRTFLILDRRKRHLSAYDDRIDLLSIERTKSALDGSDVYVALAKWRQETDLDALSSLNIASQEYRRVMDRFYIPIVQDVSISSVLFDTIASMYEQFISLELNLEVTKSLIRAVMPASNIQPAEILDFGCGTGIAATAITELGLSGSVHLVGTDVSVAMTEICRRKGEDIVDFRGWQNCGKSCWDGAIASFVLHYGVPSSDLNKLGQQMKTGARFAANYFKGTEESISNVVQALAFAGVSLEMVRSSITTRGSENPILVFVKD